MFCDVSVTEWSDLSNTCVHSLPEIVDCVTSLACLVEGVVLLFIASPTIVSYIVNHMFSSRLCDCFLAKNFPRSLLELSTPIRSNRQGPNRIFDFIIADNFLGHHTFTNL